MIYSENLRIGMILNGGTAYCYSQDELDTLVKELHSCDGHKGVVISGYNPWTVNVVLNNTYKGTQIDAYPGKYFKTIVGPKKYIGVIHYVDEKHVTSLMTYSDGGEDDLDFTDWEFVEVKPVWKEV